MKKVISFILPVVLYTTAFSQTNQIIVTIIDSEPTSGITSIQYEFSGTYLSYDISLEVRFEGDSYQPIPTADLSGDLLNVAPGIRNIVWNGAASFPGQYSAQTRIRVTAIPNFTCGDQITDVEGHVYNTVLIGEQCWMKENLNTGTRINYNQNQTNNSVIEKYCYWYSASESNCDIYGGLYQWDEVMQYTTQEGTQGICPSGWHVPTDAEYTALTSYVSSQPGYLCNSNSILIGKALASNTLWNSSTYPCGVGNDLGTNNATGFSGLPGGYLGLTSTDPPYPLYFSIGSDGIWWTSTANNDITSWGRELYYDRALVFRTILNKAEGYSVRCLRD